MVHNNPLPTSITPNGAVCHFACPNYGFSVGLLKEMQASGLPLIPTNDKINELVDTISRPNAHWNSSIAREVIELYDTIAPWEEGICQAVKNCLNNCNSSWDKEQGQDPENHYLYKWYVLIKEFHSHAIAYCDQLDLEMQPSVNTTSSDEKRATCLKSIVDHINDNLSSNLHQSVAEIVLLIGQQIWESFYSIGATEYLNYIERNIVGHPRLDIFGKGNPVLEKDKEGNLFFALDHLRGVFAKVKTEDQSNGEVYLSLCNEYAQDLCGRSGPCGSSAVIRDTLDDKPTNNPGVKDDIGNTTNNSTNNPPTFDKSSGSSPQLWQQVIAKIDEATILPAPNYSTLKGYFKNAFLGIGANSYNYFDENFIKDLSTIKRKNEIAMVAVLVFESKHFKKSKMSFADWLRTFFSILGKEVPANQSRTRYEPNEKIRNLFRYL